MAIDEIEERDGNRIPRLRYGKTNKQNRYPRFVDLDELTDEVVSYVDTKIQDELNNYEPNIPEPVDPAVTYSTVAWVDKTYGNNTTGELGRFDRPFATYGGALGAINIIHGTLTNVNRALIYFRSGSYGNAGSMNLRSYIDVYCEPGVVFGVGSRILDSTYSSIDGFVEARWLGYASYYNPSTSTSTFFELNGNSEIHAEFDKIDSFSGPIFMGNTGTAYFKCRKVETKGYFQSGGISVRGSRTVVIDITEQIRSSAATFKIRQFTGNLVVNCPKMICSNENFLGGNLKQVLLTETSSNGTAVFNGDMIQEDDATYYGGIGAVVTIWSGGGGNYTINGNIYANNSRAGIGQLSTGALVKHNGNIISKRKVAELNVGTTLFNNSSLVNENTYEATTPVISIANSAKAYFQDCLLYNGADITSGVDITSLSAQVYFYNCLHSGIGTNGWFIFASNVGTTVQIHNTRSNRDLNPNVSDVLTPTGFIFDANLITPNFI